MYDPSKKHRRGRVLALIIDDHVLIRDAMRGMLEAFTEVSSVLEAATATDAERMLDETANIGLVLLDLSLPDRDGITLLKSVRKNRPEICVIMLSASEDRAEMGAALEAGASGFIPKSATRDVMQSALRLVFSGGIYVPPEILARPTARPPQRPPDSALRAATKLGLTERQVEVLQFMMLGMSNKAICRALDIAEPTVKNHVTAILRALGATNRTEAVMAAASLGISTSNDGD